jgi:hypothetical protein
VRRPGLTAPIGRAAAPAVLGSADRSAAIGQHHHRPHRHRHPQDWHHDPLPASYAPPAPTATRRIPPGEVGRARPWPFRAPAR